MKAHGWVKNAAPILFSLGLLAGVIWWVSPQKLAEAAEKLDWQLLVPATLAMVVALYLWDSFCLPAVYRLEGHQITYRQSLRQRGLSYFAGALNYELGQAVLAWGMARLQQASVVRMLTRSVLLAYHDILVLLLMGLFGSCLSSDPRAERLRPLIVTGLAIALAIGAILWLLPARVRDRFRWADTESLLAGWSFARSARLVPLRFVYFGILVVYAAVALAICRIPVDLQTVTSAVPMVLLADGLPNFAGLGTRETTLQLVLAPGEPNATLLAMSLIWSTGMLFGRFLIALAFVAWRPSPNYSRAEDVHE